MTLEISSQPYEPSLDVRAKLDQAIAAGLDRLRPYRDELAFEQVVEPFFTWTKIIDAFTTAEFPIVRGHLAIAPTREVRALSGSLENLSWLVKLDPPKFLDTLDGAKLYARNADFWTSDNEWRDFAIESFDWIYWRIRLTDADRKVIEALRQSVAAEIGPPQAVESAAGYRITFWVIADYQLIRRELVVARTGELTRVDDVRAKDLPVYAGRLWEMVNGRMVPTD